MPPNMSELLLVAERLADEAQKETLPRFRSRTQVFNKAGVWFDPVTDADRESERSMRRMVQMLYPKHGILGEEFGEEFGAGFDGTDKRSDYRWVFDPIDGTRAYVCGTTSWLTLIALEYKGHAVLGVLDQPFTGERWVATCEETIFIHQNNKRKCQTSALDRLDRARITTTDPRRTQAYFDAAGADAFKKLSLATRLARFSLDAYGYGLLALGEIDIILESGLARHDYAALEPVIVGAGGVITNWSGNPLGSDDNGEVLACANKTLHEQALMLLK